MVATVVLAMSTKSHQLAKHHRKNSLAIALS